MPSVSVLIVVYNPGREIFDCIGSLNQISVSTAPLEIIVVDNGSTNDLASELPARFPGISVIFSRENLGFGGGNNLAFAHSTGEFILCLNPDLVINSDALHKLLTYLQQHEDAGIVGPRTHDDDGKLVYTARAEYTVMRLWVKYWMLDTFLPRLVYGDYVRKMQTSTNPFDVDWLQGSCLLIRREVYEAVNGFDDEFFLYLEDADLCERVWKAGWRVTYIPDAVVKHSGGTTTGRFHAIRIRSFHVSPIHYHRKRQHAFGVFLLRCVFWTELLAKIVVRWGFNRLRYSQSRAERIQAEYETLKQIWQV